MTLQLEYTCTEKERNEAKSLHLHRQYGGGPKWRSTLFFYAFVALIAGGLYLRFKYEIAPKDRWWFVLLVAVVFTAFKIFQRKFRAKADGVVRVEISDHGVAVGSSAAHHATLPWAGFKECLESPALFVLVNRTSHLLYILPKRAFPDESSQNWFRTLANQPKGVAPAADEPLTPARFAGKGITLTIQLKYRDYLTRMLTSWRMRGMALLIGGIFLGVSVFSFVNPPPDAVVPPWKVALFMMASLIPIATVVFFVVGFYWWCMERKSLVTEHISLSSDGIQFASRDGEGVLRWATYKFYLETRWAFFIWRPQGSLWFMVPKRAFTSPSDLEQCRELLQKNLKSSRWFYF